MYMLCYLVTYCHFYVSDCTKGGYHSDLLLEFTQTHCSPTDLGELGDGQVHQYLCNCQISLITLLMFDIIL